MKSLLLALALLPLGLCHGADSVGALTPPIPGPFAAVPDFKAKFGFGWSGIQAAEATTVLKHEGKYLHVKVEGGSTGMARSLWQLDAVHDAYIDAKTLRPVSVDQLEKYSDRSVVSTIRYTPEQVWYMRDVSVDKGKKARWKSIKIPNVFDILSAVIFVRSMPLNNGDKIRLICFPDSSPFVGQVNVLGRETIQAMGKSVNAIHVRMDISKIETSHGKIDKVVAYSKFKSGEVWISDDDRRIPLKARVNIFVGYIYGEIISYDKL